jgi:hypothetical protein
MEMQLTYNFHTGGDGLLAKDVLVSCNRLERLFGVHCSGRGDNHGNQALVLEHVVVVLVQPDAEGLEMSLSPFQLDGVRGASSDQFSSRSTFEEVEGMALAHTAKAGTANFQSLSRHYVELN